MPDLPSDSNVPQPNKTASGPTPDYATVERRAVQRAVADLLNVPTRGWFQMAELTGTRRAGLRQQAMHLAVHGGIGKPPPTGRCGITALEAVLFRLFDINPDQCRARQQDDFTAACRKLMELPPSR